MISIGIDPGISGALAILPPVGAPRVHEMPTIALGKSGKRAIDGYALARLLDDIAELSVMAGGGVATVYLERVNAFPGQGVTSMFSLGMSFWGAFCTCAALKLPVTLVEPRDWKGHFKLNADKELARALAIRYYPMVDLTRKKDHGKAEALLIARYGHEHSTRSQR